MPLSTQPPKGPRIRHPQWVAPEDDLISGRCVTKLRLAILAYGGTDKNVAALSGMPPPRISEYSLGKRPITPKHLFSLCQVLGCAPDDLLGVEYLDENITHIPYEPSP
jgi:transcriptional regulator with XRE-family HTH domain